MWLYVCTYGIRKKTQRHNVVEAFKMWRKQNKNEINPDIKLRKEFASPFTNMCEIVLMLLLFSFLFLAFFSFSLKIFLLFFHSSNHKFYLFFFFLPNISHEVTGNIANTIHVYMQASWNYGIWMQKWTPETAWIEMKKKKKKEKRRQTETTILSMLIKCD